jgi:iron-sulfur cluster assembly protein
MIKKQLKDKDRENALLRIFVKGFGWGGPTFGIALEGSKDDTKDHYEEINGLKLIVEKDILNQFHNFHIDYSDGWFSRGFRISAGMGGSSC